MNISHKFIKIDGIRKNNNSLDIDFTVSEELKNFFKSNRFNVEYDEPIDKVPDSIAVIPFVCNVLPIVWLTGATLYIDSLDEDYMEGYPQILNGYKKMYPNMTFNGEMKVRSIEHNECNYVDEKSKAAAFFSGGVDAFATLIAHVDECPRLITIWGADINLKDVSGWSVVKEHVIETASNFETSQSFIKSNFREFIDYKSCSELVKKSKDNYWHGFQHGIGLISHAAPISWLHGIRSLYIASSMTPKDKITCASDPTIDNHVHFSGCDTHHDQYEFDRIEKVEHIIKYANRTGVPIDIRVCWISKGGKNCCRCEKCMRTMFEVFGCGDDPKKYGFNYTKSDLKTARNRLLVSLDPKYAFYYYDVSKRLRNGNGTAFPRELDWIRDFNLDREKNRIGFKIYNTGYRIYSFFNKVRIKLGLLVK